MVTVLARDPEEPESLQGKNTVQVSSRTGVEPGKKAAEQTSSLLPEGGWNDDNWPSADNPGNQPGNPPGGPIDGGAGNGNFQLSAPVVSLPGRGIDLALNLNYNSRLWNKAGNELTYDIDQSFPAPGWSLGFGKIVFMGAGGCMLIDADGTRHSYTGTPYPWTNGMSFTGSTADGSFIDYGCTFNFGNYGSGWAVLPNGTRITYSTISATPSIVLPTSITDAQGNFISITYRSHPSIPQIETVTDTMGRVITFHYDNLNRLIEVRAPRMQDQDPIYGGGNTRTVVRLHYKPLTLAYSFGSSITPVVRQSTVQMIDAIYYPGTKTGYWFDDSDSYSTYGMITKVVEQRGMDWQTSSEEQGEVIAGDMTKQADYNYPLTTINASGRTNGTGLTDAPIYTTLKESWAGRDVQEDAITTYSINANVTRWDGFNQSPAREITVTQPSGVISKQYSYRLSAGAWSNGLVFNDETVVMNGSTPTVISSSLVAWQQGNYESPRPYWAKIWDEKGDEIRTEYTYGTNKFNQITKSCDYDDANTKLRCATAEYENSSNYIGNFNASGKFTSGRHIFNLVKKSAVENPNGTKTELTEYEYDNNAVVNGTQNHGLVAAPGVVQHEHASNPYTTETIPVAYCVHSQFDHPQCSYEGETIWACIPESHDPCYWHVCSLECLEWDYEYISVYNPNTVFRGNVTKATTYENAASLTGAIYETRSYDITGNLVSNSAACCEQKSYLYTVATQYAYPESSTHGAADPQSPHRVTTSAVYSYETGLVKQATDPNGLTSTSWYNPDTLRPVKSVSSTGAYSTIAYDDEAMTIEEEVREFAAVGQGVLAGRSKKYLNGIGLVRKEESFAPSSIVDIVETQYTKFGEAWKQSRPFRAGDTVYWSEKFYDDQRRLVKVVEPDGSTTEAFYNETTIPDSVTAAPGNTIRIADAWGRERWGRYDQQGRLVHVVEPNPDKTANPTGKVVSVAGSLLTKYKYDTLGRLFETEQGSQFRKFKYDSLGRLTRQKLAEQTATLNDAGAFVGVGGVGAVWSEAFVYDNRSNLIQKTDVRGVRTNFSFQIGGGEDPLNRIQMRSYDLSGPVQPNLTIHAAPAVTYEYMPTGDKTRIKKITTAGILTEDYTYDGESRVNEYKQTVAVRESYPMTTSYVYDTLDRVKEVHYPAQYGLSGSPRKIVAHSYDTASRLTQMTYGGAVQASDMVFNAADQTTSIKIGAAGANQVTEQYTFDPQTGLLTNQKAIRGSSTLLDLSYEYRRKVNGSYVAGRTGHLTEMINNLDRNRDRSYEYDALGRLIKAAGGVNQTWTQYYQYDRYGNRTQVTAHGFESLTGPDGQAGVTDTLQKTIDPRQQSVFENPLAGILSKGPLAATGLPKDINGFVEDGRRGRGPSAESGDERRETGEENAEEEGKRQKVKGQNPKTEAQSPKPGETHPETGSRESGKSLDRLTPPSAYTPFDFDGDGRADFSAWNRASANWTVHRSGTSQTTVTQLGAAGSQIAPGDYDGDGKTDEAVWNPETGVWTIRFSSNGNIVTVQWGQKGDAIVPADYDGDGKTDIAVWRPGTGDWWVVKSSDNDFYAVNFGGQAFGDIPIVDDYDGDGHADIAVWRPTGGEWWVLVLGSSGGQVLQYQFGLAGDVPVVADYDGDGMADLAVWRPSEGVWYVYQSSNGQVLTAQLGSEAARDILVPADYDGDGKTDIAVWRPSTGTWTVKQSTTGNLVTHQLGTSGEIAVPSAYIRRSSAPNNQSMEIPTDGIPNLTYDAASNRITTAGFEHDNAGNQTRALAADGVSWMKYEYDAANRLRVVKRDSDGGYIQTFQYGSTNARVLSLDHASNQLTIYAATGGTTLAEYVEFTANVPTWTKSYTYLGSSQLATVTPNGTGGEYVEFNHPDRLGTKVITNQPGGTSYEQNTLPFGTALNAESTGSTNKRFTSYDRSNATGLDYAINRTYDSKQGRFTQIDPIGMQAVDLNKPQTFNLYTYCGNDPVNHVDPDGLFFGKLLKGILKFFKKALKWIALAISVAIAVLTIIYAPVLFATTLKMIFGIVGAIANAASSVLNAFGLAKAGAVFGIIAGFASLGTSFLAARSAMNWKTILGAVSSAATATSRTLSALGYHRLGQIFGLAATVTRFISGGLKPQTGRVGGLKWDPSRWETYKFVRSSAEQVASIAGANRVAGFLNTLGIIDDVGDLYKTARMTQQAILQSVVGPDDIHKLDFWSNTKRLLTGQEEDNARFYGYIVPGILRIYGEQFGRVNSIIRRVERGVALAR